MISAKSYKVIACESMARAVYAFSALSPHKIDIQLLQIGLHDHPPDLRQRIQEQIDANNGRLYDAILLVYGLCGRAIDGLKSRQIPLVVPRAHDCITLLLGSRAAYREQQNAHPGTYWYSQDYLERSSRYGQSMALGSAAISDRQAVYEQYVLKYGIENAEYLMQTMESWQKRYDRAVLVETEFGVSDQIRANVLQQSAEHGWQLETMIGDLNVVRRLIEGDWNDDFLFVEPNSQIIMQNDEGILASIPLTD